MISKTEQKLIYSASTLLSTDKKTAESLAKISGISGDTMLRTLRDKSIKPEELIKMAMHFFGTNYLNVILDDTALEKMYSQLIEGSGDNYDASTGHTYRSLCAVVGMLSDGKHGFPVKHDFWINKELLGDAYRTKVQIAKEIVQFITQFVRIKCLIADGLYATQEMFYWLQEKNIPYEMRFHSNRLIQLNEKDTPVKVRDHEALKLKNKRQCKTVKALWKGLTVYITAVKRTDRKGNVTIVYQISNTKLPAREHVRRYTYRWHIEIFFRTGKQSLGLKECQSRKLLCQNNHLYNVFFAYFILQLEKRKRKLKNAECALRLIKKKKYKELIAYLYSLDEIIHAFERAHA